MDIVKKNLVSIICGVVALLFIALAFFPLGGFYESLDKDLSASAKDADDIKRLNSQSFAKPIVDPAKREPEPLERFPNQKVIDAGRAAVEKMTQQAQNVTKAVLNVNAKRPLFEQALTSMSGAPRSTFKRLYAEKFEEFKRQMNAGSPPTAEEIKLESERSLKEEWEPRIAVVGGAEQNRQEIMDQYEKWKAALPLKMRLDRARQFSVYVRPKAFDVDPGIPPMTDSNLPGNLEIWQAQLSLWIQEDIVKSIAATNEKYGDKKKTGVDAAVVKSLVRIAVPKSYIASPRPLPISEAAKFAAADAAGRDPNAVGGPIARAAAGEVDPAIAMKRIFAISPTARVSNPLYDVMHFTVSVDVDARLFPHFMAELTRNKLITIIEANMVAVDGERAQLAGLMYGNTPIVQLTLKGEALFFRDWTTKWMPQGVKRLLKIEERPAADGAVADAR
jgi:hypothetical protein